MYEADKNVTTQPFRVNTQTHTHIEEESERLSILKEKN